jgi:uncharacterized protein YdaT
MAENDRHVVPDGDGGWAVEKGDHERVSSKHATQEDAMRRAHEIVANAGGGEVVVHGTDGQIRDKRTVGKDDPFPPAG